MVLEPAIRGGRRGEAGTGAGAGDPDISSNEEDEEEGEEKQELVLEPVILTSLQTRRKERKGRNWCWSR